MVAMQMADHDGIDRGEIDRRLFQRDQARGAAIDQETTACAGHQKAGIEPPAAAEGVAAANEAKLHEGKDRGRLDLIGGNDFIRHLRESGGPQLQTRPVSLDSRVRGNDVVIHGATVGNMVSAPLTIL